jgi:hypothetical protein
VEAGGGVPPPPGGARNPIFREIGGLGPKWPKMGGFDPRNGHFLGFRGSREGGYPPRGGPGWGVRTEGYPPGGVGIPDF